MSSSLGVFVTQTLVHMFVLPGSLLQMQLLLEFLEKSRKYINYKRSGPRKQNRQEKGQQQNRTSACYLRRRCMPRGLDLFGQCAAVTTQFGLIRDPPHIWYPSLRRETCHGQECGAASSPFTTRVDWNGRLPQPMIRVAYCQGFLMRTLTYVRRLLGRRK